MTKKLDKKCDGILSDVALMMSKLVDQTFSDVTNHSYFKDMLEGV